MSDSALAGLLAAVADGDLEAVLILCDFLEDRGDPRADQVRRLYPLLYDEWMYAPLAFRHFSVPGQHILPLFPEHQAQATS
jgi:hypothetical protein